MPGIASVSTSDAPNVAAIADSASRSPVPIGHTGAPSGVTTKSPADGETRSAQPEEPVRSGLLKRRRSGGPRWFPRAGMRELEQPPRTGADRVLGVAEIAADREASAEAVAREP